MATNRRNGHTMGFPEIFKKNNQNAQKKREFSQTLNNIINFRRIIT
jgi:hypothetical protein